MSSNMNNINNDDFKNICRMCMFKCDIKFDLDCIVSNIFYKLTDIHFETNDDLPKQICRKCFEKINEIREFAFQCKQTHSALMECLNKQQNVVQNENIEQKYILPIVLNKYVKIDKHETDCVDDNSLNFTENLEIDFEQIVIKEETNNDLKDETIPEEIEIDNDQSINCSENNFLIPSTVKNEEVSDDDTNLNDLNGDTNFSTSNINSQCSNSSNQSEILKEHIDVRSLKCDKCSKSFKYVDYLKTHMRTHTGEHPSKCEQASESFNQSSHPNGDMRTHTGDRPYKCTQCSKSFAYSNVLTRHMLTHTGDRPFKCMQCSKSFTQSNVLKDHIRTHTGERPYKCKQCSKSFAYSKVLTKHMRTHTGERPYKCKQCSKSFTRSHNLKIHMRAHTGERP